MGNNRDLFRKMSTARAHFYPCDFHVHSPGSGDVRLGQRFERLSRAEQTLLQGIPPGLADDARAYERAALLAYPPSDFYGRLLGRRDEVATSLGLTSGDDWAFIAITDHNVCEYAEQLSGYAWERRAESRLIIFPGIELDVSFPVDGLTDRVKAHLLVIFAPCTTASDIRIALSTASGTVWNEGEHLSLPALADFVRKVRIHTKYPAISIAAHIGSSKGVQNEMRKGILSHLDVAISRMKGELSNADVIDRGELTTRLAQLKAMKGDDNAIALEVLRLIGDCGFDALHVGAREDEVHYRRLHRFSPAMGRAAPLVCSDAHCVSEVFTCTGGVPHLKLPAVSAGLTPSQLFFQVREHAMRFGETRLSYAPPGRVSNWISGIEIVRETKDAAEFWPFEKSATAGEAAGVRFVLPFSRNLTCLIGGRGSGKSALLEAVAFTSRASDFVMPSNRLKDPPDWYKRAKATLQGCRVTVCWQFMGAGDLDHLPKRALFATRFFDAQGQHSGVVYSDLENNELTGNQVPVNEVQFFRVHDIETAAHPEKLRNLFDEICGPDIRALDAEIDLKTQSLRRQREGLLKIATMIQKLTYAGSPLLDLANRASQFRALNSEEVRNDYEQIDLAASAESMAQQLEVRWEQALEEADVTGGAAAIAAFFSEAKDRLRNGDAEGVPRVAELDEIFFVVGDGEASRDSAEVLIAEEFKGLASEIAALGSDLTYAISRIAERHKNGRELLAKKGLPVAGTARETKKKAYEESLTALTEYREAATKWDDGISARLVLRTELLDLCKRRSELRTRTARRITDQLARDLDAQILVIQADAQADADNSAFTKWLHDNLAPSGNVWKFREQRIDAMVRRGLSPDRLRDLLLSRNGVTASALVVSASGAAQGEVDLTTASRVFEGSVARHRLPPEISPQKDTASETEAVPEEVLAGFWTFDSESDGTLRVAKVLILDETVSNDVPVIKLNDRPVEAGSSLRPLETLSPGQRCSAILPILLLNGSCPLVIDQPEDNLDNRLIRQVIVNILASIKLRRQVIVATHNPNLPVLGDVERATVLRAVRDTECEIRAAGDLGESDVVRYITDIMEGGREAFQYRQTIYQAHWTQSVANAT
ncbi:MAG: protein putative AbiEii toxin, Type system [Phycisphaerales bacterium]|nr:protein putative AbiEii toxin, Type system [Phycisphaerales bacterium]